MSVTQTVDIPDSHRLVLDVPREVPTGATILTFTPAGQESAGRRSDAPQKKSVPPLESLVGIHKGKSSTEAYFARKRADKEKENAQIARQLGLDELPKIIWPK